MKTPKVKKFTVPIFTEEYSVVVFIGNLEDIKKEARLGGIKDSFLKGDFRGRAFDLLPNRHPLILIDGRLKVSFAVATLAHEASHVMDYISSHLGIDDKSGEFKSHGIAAVLRMVFENL